MFALVFFFTQFTANSIIWISVCLFKQFSHKYSPSEMSQTMNSALFPISMASVRKHSQHECSITAEFDWKLGGVMMSVHTRLLIFRIKRWLWLTACSIQSRCMECCIERSLYLANWSTAMSYCQFVYDSVCLHWALLNWLWNRLEMVLLLYTSHNSPSHQSGAIFYLEDDVSIRGCQPLTAALWVVVLGGAYC